MSYKDDRKKEISITSQAAGQEAIGDSNIREFRQNAAMRYEDQVSAVASMWARLRENCQLTDVDSRAGLIHDIYTHTVSIVLQFQWSSWKPEQRQILESAMFSSLEGEYSIYDEELDERQQSWELHLRQTVAAIHDIAKKPWTNSSITQLVKKELPETYEELTKLKLWLLVEGGCAYLYRIYELAKQKQRGMLGSLIGNTRKLLSIAEDARETSLDIQVRNAGFDQNVLDVMTDMEMIAMNYSVESFCIDKAKAMELSCGLDMVQRLRKRLDSVNKDLPMWKDCKHIIKTCAQMFVARLVTAPFTDDLHKMLYEFCCELIKTTRRKDLSKEISKIMGLARSAKHLHVCTLAARDVCSDNLPFVVENYVRTLTAATNELEEFRTDKQEDDMKKHSAMFSSWLLEVADLLRENERVTAECVLTAFSLTPDHKMYNMVRQYQHCAISKETQSEVSQPTEPSASSTSTGWSRDSQSRNTFLVKTSERLWGSEGPSASLRASIVSVEVLEGLGLHPDLCQDFIVLLSGPRVKTLSWDMKWELLDKNCQIHIEKTNCGTTLNRELSSVLDSLNLNDPGLSGSDDDDICTGIEKGYEPVYENIAVEMQPQQFHSRFIDDYLDELDDPDSPSKEELAEVSWLPASMRKKSQKRHTLKSEKGPRSIKIKNKKHNTRSKKIRRKKLLQPPPLEEVIIPSEEKELSDNLVGKKIIKTKHVLKNPLSVKRKNTTGINKIKQKIIAPKKVIRKIVSYDDTKGPDENNLNSSDEDVSLANFKTDNAEKLDNFTLANILDSNTPPISNIIYDSFAETCPDVGSFRNVMFENPKMEAEVKDAPPKVENETTKKIVPDFMPKNDIKCKTSIGIPTSLTKFSNSILGQAAASSTELAPTIGSIGVGTKIKMLTQEIESLKNNPSTIKSPVTSNELNTQFKLTASSESEQSSHQSTSMLVQFQKPNMFEQKSNTTEFKNKKTFDRININQDQMTASEKDILNRLFNQNSLLITRKLQSNSGETNLTNINHLKIEKITKKKYVRNKNNETADEAEKKPKRVYVCNKKQPNTKESNVLSTNLLNIDQLTTIQMVSNKMNQSCPESGINPSQVQDAELNFSNIDQMKIEMKQKKKYVKKKNGEAPIAENKPVRVYNPKKKLHDTKFTNVPIKSVLNENVDRLTSIEMLKNEQNQPCPQVVGNSSLVEVAALKKNGIWDIGYNLLKELCKFGQLYGTNELLLKYCCSDFFMDKNLEGIWPNEVDWIVRKILLTFKLADIGQIKHSVSLFNRILKDDFVPESTGEITDDIRRKSRRKMQNNKVLKSLLEFFERESRRVVSPLKQEKLSVSKNLFETPKSGQNLIPWSPTVPTKNVVTQSNIYTNPKSGQNLIPILSPVPTQKAITQSNLYATSKYGQSLIPRSQTVPKQNVVTLASHYATLKSGQNLMPRSPTVPAQNVVTESNLYATPRTGQNLIPRSPTVPTQHVVTSPSRNSSTANLSYTKTTAQKIIVDGRINIPTNNSTTSHNLDNKQTKNILMQSQNSIQRLAGQTPLNSSFVCDQITRNSPWQASIQKVEYPENVPRHSLQMSQKSAPLPTFSSLMSGLKSGSYSYNVDAYEHICSSQNDPKTMELGYSDPLPKFSTAISSNIPLAVEKIHRNLTEDKLELGRQTATPTSANSDSASQDHSMVKMLLQHKIAKGQKYRDINCDNSPRNMPSDQKQLSHESFRNEQINSNKKHDTNEHFVIDKQLHNNTKHVIQVVPSSNSGTPILQIGSITDGKTSNTNCGNMSYLPKSKKGSQLDNVTQVRSVIKATYERLVNSLHRPSVIAVPSQSLMSKQKDLHSQNLPQSLLKPAGILKVTGKNESGFYTVGIAKSMESKNNYERTLSLNGKIGCAPISENMLQTRMKYDMPTETENLTYNAGTIISENITTSGLQVGSVITQSDKSTGTGLGINLSTYPRVETDTMTKALSRKYSHKKNRIISINYTTDCSPNKSLPSDKVCNSQKKSSNGKFINNKKKILILEDVPVTAQNVFNRITSPLGGLSENAQTRSINYFKQETLDNKINQIFDPNQSNLEKKSTKPRKPCVLDIRDGEKREEKKEKDVQHVIKNLPNITINKLYCKKEKTDDQKMDNVPSVSLIVKNVSSREHNLSLPVTCEADDDFIGKKIIYHNQNISSAYPNNLTEQTQDQLNFVNSEFLDKLDTSSKLVTPKSVDSSHALTMKKTIFKDGDIGQKQFSISILKKIATLPDVTTVPKPLNLQKVCRSGEECADGQAEAQKVSGCRESQHAAQMSSSVNEIRTPSHKAKYSLNKANVALNKYQRDDTQEETFIHQKNNKQIINRLIVPGLSIRKVSVLKTNNAENASTHNNTQNDAGQNENRDYLPTQESSGFSCNSFMGKTECRNRDVEHKEGINPSEINMPQKQLPLQNEVEIEEQQRDVLVFEREKMDAFKKQQKIPMSPNALLKRQKVKKRINDGIITPAKIISLPWYQDDKSWSHFSSPKKDLEGFSRTAIKVGTDETSSVTHTKTIRELDFNRATINMEMESPSKTVKQFVGKRPGPKSRTMAEKCATYYTTHDESVKFEHESEIKRNSVKQEIESNFQNNLLKKEKEIQSNSDESTEDQIAFQSIAEVTCKQKIQSDSDEAIAQGREYQVQPFEPIKQETAFQTNSEVSPKQEREIKNNSNSKRLFEIDQDIGISKNPIIDVYITQKGGLHRMDAKELGDGMLQDKNLAKSDDGIPENSIISKDSCSPTNTKAEFFSAVFDGNELQNEEDGDKPKKIENILDIEKFVNDIKETISENTITMNEVSTDTMSDILSATDNESENDYVSETEQNISDIESLLENHVIVKRATFPIDNNVVKKLDVNDLDLQSYSDSDTTEETDKIQLPDPSSEILISKVENLVMNPSHPILDCINDSSTAVNSRDINDFESKDTDIKVCDDITHTNIYLTKNSIAANDTLHTDDINQHRIEQISENDKIIKSDSDENVAFIPIKTNIVDFSAIKKSQHCFKSDISQDKIENKSDTRTVHHTNEEINIVSTPKSTTIADKELNSVFPPHTTLEKILDKKILDDGSNASVEFTPRDTNIGHNQTVLSDTETPIYKSDVNQDHTKKISGIIQSFESMRNDCIVSNNIVDKPTFVNNTESQSEIESDTTLGIVEKCTDMATIIEKHTVPTHVDIEDKLVGNEIETESEIKSDTSEEIDDIVEKISDIESFVGNQIVSEPFSNMDKFTTQANILKETTDESTEVFNTNSKNDFESAPPHFVYKEINQIITEINSKSLNQNSFQIRTPNLTILVDDVGQSQNNVMSNEEIIENTKNCPSETIDDKELSKNYKPDKMIKGKKKGLFRDMLSTTSMKTNMPQNKLQSRRLAQVAKRDSTSKTPQKRITRNSVQKIPTQFTEKNIRKTREDVKKTTKEVTSRTVPIKNDVDPSILPKSSLNIPSTVIVCPRIRKVPSRFADKKKDIKKTQKDKLVKSEEITSKSVPKKFHVEFSSGPPKTSFKVPATANVCPRIITEEESSILLAHTKKIEHMEMDIVEVVMDDPLSINLEEQEGQQEDNNMDQCVKKNIDISVNFVKNSEDLKLSDDEKYKACSKDNSPLYMFPLSNYSCRVKLNKKNKKSFNKLIYPSLKNQICTPKIHPLSDTIMNLFTQKKSLDNTETSATRKSLRQISNKKIKKNVDETENNSQITSDKCASDMGKRQQGNSEKISQKNSKVRTNSSNVEIPSMFPNKKFNTNVINMAPLKTNESSTVEEIVVSDSESDGTSEPDVIISGESRKRSLTLFQYNTINSIKDPKLKFNFFKLFIAQNRKLNTASIQSEDVICLSSDEENEKKLEHIDTKENIVEEKHEKENQANVFEKSCHLGTFEKNTKYNVTMNNNKNVSEPSVENQHKEISIEIPALNCKINPKQHLQKKSMTIATSNSNPVDTKILHEKKGSFVDLKKKEKTTKARPDTMKTLDLQIADDPNKSVDAKKSDDVIKIVDLLMKDSKKTSNSNIAYSDIESVSVKTVDIMTVDPEKVVTKKTAKKTNSVDTKLDDSKKTVDFENKNVTITTVKLPHVVLDMSANFNKAVDTLNVESDIVDINKKVHLNKRVDIMKTVDSNKTADIIKSVDLNKTADIMKTVDLNKTAGAMIAVVPEIVDFKLTVDSKNTAGKKTVTSTQVDANQTVDLNKTGKKIRINSDIVNSKLKVIMNKGVNTTTDKSKNMADKIKTNDLVMTAYSDIVDSKFIVDSEIVDSKFIVDSEIVDSKFIVDSEIVDSKFIVDSEIVDSKFIVDSEIVDSKFIVDSEIVDSKFIVDSEIVDSKFIVDSEIVDSKFIVDSEIVDSEKKDDLNKTVDFEKTADSVKTVDSNIVDTKMIESNKTADPVKTLKSVIYNSKKSANKKITICSKTVDANKTVHLNKTAKPMISGDVYVINSKIIFELNKIAGTSMTVDSKIGDSKETVDFEIVDSKKTVDLNKTAEPMISGDLDVVNSKTTFELSKIADTSMTVDSKIGDSKETVDFEIVDSKKTVDLNKTAEPMISGDLDVVNSKTTFELSKIADTSMTVDSKIGDSKETVDFEIVDSKKTVDLNKTAEPMISGDLDVVNSKTTFELSKIADTSMTVDSKIGDSKETVDFEIVDSKKTVDIKKKIDSKNILDSQTSGVSKTVDTDKSSDSTKTVCSEDTLEIKNTVDSKDETKSCNKTVESQLEKTTISNINTDPILPSHYEKEISINIVKEFVKSTVSKNSAEAEPYQPKQTSKKIHDTSIPKPDSSKINVSQPHHDIIFKSNSVVKSELYLKTLPPTNISDSNDNTKLNQQLDQFNKITNLKQPDENVNNIRSEMHREVSICDSKVSIQLNTPEKRKYFESNEISDQQKKRICVEESQNTNNTWDQIRTPFKTYSKTHYMSDKTVDSWLKSNITTIEDKYVVKNKIHTQDDVETDKEYLENESGDNVKSDVDSLYSDLGFKIEKDVSRDSYLNIILPDNPLVGAVSIHDTLCWDSTESDYSQDLITIPHSDQQEFDCNDNISEDPETPRSEDEKSLCSIDCASDELLAENTTLSVSSGGVENNTSHFARNSPIILDDSLNNNCEINFNVPKNIGDTNELKNLGPPCLVKLYNVIEKSDKVGECTTKPSSDIGDSVLAKVKERTIGHKQPSPSNQDENETKKSKITKKGFGKVSDRVFVTSGITESPFGISAAALSDIKPQPLRSSEEKENEINAINTQKDLRKYLKEKKNLTSKGGKMHLRSSLRSNESFNIFKKYYETQEKDVLNEKILSNILGLDNYNLLVPTKQSYIVHVVEVRQFCGFNVDQNTVSSANDIQTQRDGIAPPSEDTSSNASETPISEISDKQENVPDDSTEGKNTIEENVITMQEDITPPQSSGSETSILQQNDQDISPNYTKITDHSEMGNCKITGGNLKLSVGIYDTKKDFQMTATEVAAKIGKISGSKDKVQKFDGERKGPNCLTKRSNDNIETAEHTDRIEVPKSKEDRKEVPKSEENKTKDFLEGKYEMTGTLKEENKEKPCIKIAEQFCKNQPIEDAEQNILITDIEFTKQNIQNSVTLVSDEFLQMENGQINEDSIDQGLDENCEVLVSDENIVISDDHIQLTEDVENIEMDDDPMMNVEIAEQNCLITDSEGIEDQMLDTEMTENDYELSNIPEDDIQIDSQMIEDEFQMWDAQHNIPMANSEIDVDSTPMVDFTVPCAVISRASTLGSESQCPEPYDARDVNYIRIADAVDSVRTLESPLNEFLSFGNRGREVQTTDVNYIDALNSESTELQNAVPEINLDQNIDTRDSPFDYSTYPTISEAITPAIQSIRSEPQVQLVFTSRPKPVLVNDALNLSTSAMKNGDFNSENTESNVSQANAPNEKSTIKNALMLQQALAQLLPPLQNHQNSVPQPLIRFIQQGRNTPVSLVDKGQQSTSNTNAQFLHVVQNKIPGNQNSGTVSLAESNLQHGNQVIHIVNSSNQAKVTSAAQLLKRVNLLTSLTNCQGGKEQKMVQFVCKSADGKSIHLNSPHRGMVFRLQPVETVRPPTPVTQTPPSIPDPPSDVPLNLEKKAPESEQEIRSRSTYEENYAKFIRSKAKKAQVAKAKGLPKFNQAFGKATFQDNTNENRSETEDETEQTNVEPILIVNDVQQAPQDGVSNPNVAAQIAGPPLLIRKSPQTVVQQIKQAISPAQPLQTIQGGVIYTRQIPMNLSSGQTINLITVPNPENAQKQDPRKVNLNNVSDSPVIKIIQASNAGGNNEIKSEKQPTCKDPNATQVHPVVTQMRIRLPMLSKTPQMIGNARLVRPYIQIQRNVIAGQNQPVYQQLVLTTAAPQQTITTNPPQSTSTVQSPIQSAEPNISSSTLEQLREFDMVFEQVKERSTLGDNNTETSQPEQSLVVAEPRSQSDSIYQHSQVVTTVVNKKIVKRTISRPMVTCHQTPPSGTYTESSTVTTYEETKSTTYAETEAVTNYEQVQQRENWESETVETNEESETITTFVESEPMRFVEAPPLNSYEEPQPLTYQELQPVAYDDSISPITSYSESHTIRTFDDTQSNYVESHTDSSFSEPLHVNTYQGSPILSYSDTQQTSYTESQPTSTISDSNDKSIEFSATRKSSKKKKKKTPNMIGVLPKTVPPLSPNKLIPTIVAPTHKHPPMTKPPPLSKPQEDDETTQRILYILADYKDQLENCPDKDRPAPRRRNLALPIVPGERKRKKGKKTASQNVESPSDDPNRTLGSEDSSCGTSQADYSENNQSIDMPSPLGSPSKASRRYSFQQDISEASTSGHQKSTNTEGPMMQVPAKATTAVLMPGNYLLPVSMMKGGQQITIVTNQGQKILTLPQGDGASNALLLQRLFGAATLKTVQGKPTQILRPVHIPTVKTQPLNLSGNVVNPGSSPDLNNPNIPCSESPKMFMDTSTSDVESRDITTSKDNTPMQSNIDLSMESSANEDTDTNEPLTKKAKMKHKKPGTVNLIQLHSLGSTEGSPTKVFSVGNSAQFGSILQLAGCKSSSAVLKAAKMPDLGQSVMILRKHESTDQFVLETNDSSGNQEVKILPGLVARCGSGAIIAMKQPVKMDATQNSEVQKTGLEGQNSWRFMAASNVNSTISTSTSYSTEKSNSEECEDVGVDAASGSDLFTEKNMIFSSTPTSLKVKHQDGASTIASNIQNQGQPVPPLVQHESTKIQLSPSEVPFSGLHTSSNERFLITKDTPVLLQDPTMALGEGVLLRDPVVLREPTMVLKEGPAILRDSMVLREPTMVLKEAPVNLRDSVVLREPNMVLRNEKGEAVDPFSDEGLGLMAAAADMKGGRIMIDEEEFAREHPNTTFHSEELADEAVVQPFSVVPRGSKNKRYSSVESSTSDFHHALSEPVIISTHATKPISEYGNTDIIDSKDIFKDAISLQDPNLGQSCFKNVKKSKPFPRKTPVKSTTFKVNEGHLKKIIDTGFAGVDVNIPKNDDHLKQLIDDSFGGKPTGDSGLQSPPSFNPDLFWEANNKTIDFTLKDVLPTTPDAFDALIDKPSTPFAKKSTTKPQLRINSVIKSPKDFVSNSDKVTNTADSSTPDTLTNVDDTKKPPMRTYPSKRAVNARKQAEIHKQEPEGTNNVDGSLNTFATSILCGLRDCGTTSMLIRTKVKSDAQTVSQKFHSNEITITKTGVKRLNYNGTVQIPKKRARVRKPVTSSMTPVTMTDSVQLNEETFVSK